jgi:hypothetical protein
MSNKHEKKQKKEKKEKKQKKHHHGESIKEMRSIMKDLAIKTKTEQLEKIKLKDKHTFEKIRAECHKFRVSYSAHTPGNAFYANGLPLQRMEQVEVMKEALTGVVTPSALYASPVIVKEGLLSPLPLSQYLWMDREEKTADLFINSPIELANVILRKPSLVDQENRDLIKKARSTITSLLEKKKHSRRREEEEEEEDEYLTDDDEDDEEEDEYDDEDDDEEDETSSYDDTYSGDDST